MILKGRNSLIVLSLCIYAIDTYGQYSSGLHFANYRDKDNTISFEFHLNPKKTKESVQITYYPVEYISRDDWGKEVKKINNSIISWLTKTEKPVYLNLYDLVSEQSNGVWLSEPGDHIVVDASGPDLSFSGSGSEKFRLQYELELLFENTLSPTKFRFKDAFYIEDYLSWSKYYEEVMVRGIFLINQYKNEISAYSINIIRSNFVNWVANGLVSRFEALWNTAKSKKILPEQLCQVYDTSFSVIIENWSRHLSRREHFTLSSNALKLYRQYSFDPHKLPSEEKISLILYNTALKQYTGNKREQFIVSSFPEQIMLEVGFTAEVEHMLDQYYMEPGFSKYKCWMKEQELLIRRRALKLKIPEFNLSDARGNFYTNESFKGKYVVINFWSKDSLRCETIASRLKKVQHQFITDQDIIFLNICIDKNRAEWLAQVNKEKNSKKNVINVMADSEAEFPITRKFAVTSTPTIYLMDPQGKILNARPFIDLTANNLDVLEELLLKHQAYKKDGPYILYEDNKATISYIDKVRLSSVEFVSDKVSKIKIHTDLNNTLEVTLKKSIVSEPSTYERPAKLLALSDIEGNFDALRKLLQANKVIDNQFNWIFGDGHVVFAGDMFDRGMQVTECLWLLYSLEEKAKSAGGYVHFILGNHEIMNMQGDHRYVQQKYKDNAVLMNKSLTQLYSEDSELGRWLRTKNIMERIGDLLFVHAGISHFMWRMPLYLHQINDLARPYYAKAIDSSNQRLAIIFGNRRIGKEHTYPSPFWFRGYYGDIDNPGEIPSTEQLDSTLKKFKVKHIITGHTIVADTISVHYDGRVFNTDTHHAEGKSEALLIDEEHFYRVNAEGIRKQIFSRNFRM